MSDRWYGSQQDLDEEDKEKDGRDTRVGTFQRKRDEERIKQIEEEKKKK